MNDYNDYDDNIGCLLIMVFAFGILMLLFIISYYNLSKFKKCYDSNFSYSWCESYKNY